VKNNSSRPLLQVDDPLKRARELLSQRVSLYEKADLIVDTERISPQEAVQDIRKKLMSLVP
jgi:shikimate kinase